MIIISTFTTLVSWFLGQIFPEVFSQTVSLQATAQQPVSGNAQQPVSGNAQQPSGNAIQPVSGNKYNISTIVIHNNIYLYR